MRLFNIKEIYFHVFGWLMMSLLVFGFFLSGHPGPEPFWKSGMLNIVLMNLTIGVLAFYINYFFLAPRFLLKKKFTVYLFLSLLSLVAMNIMLFNLIPDPPVIKIKSMGLGFPVSKEGFNMRKEDFDFRIRVWRSITTMPGLTYFLMGGVFRLIVENVRKDELNNKILNKQKESELLQLRSQLSPHFLFNTLNSIYSLVRDKSIDAPHSIIALSELMRYMLYEANQDYVSLKSELNYIKNYISLQRLRTVDGKNIKLNISGDYGTKKIKPLIFITFIENAFKYGTNFKGETYIEINFQIGDSTIHFFCKNLKGKGNGTKNKDSGIGLENMKGRLELLYGNAYELNIDDSKDFFTVSLKLNLNEN